MTQLNELTEKLVQHLSQKKQTLALAESCTGGLLAKLITDIAGSSQIFIGGVISYTNAMKTKWLGVPPATLQAFGAVSEQTVYAMVVGIQEATGCDYGIAISGIAGPTGGTAEKPVGTVVIGWKFPDDTMIEKYVLKGNRQDIREQSAIIAFQKLFDRIEISSN